MGSRKVHATMHIFASHLPLQLGIHVMVAKGGLYTWFSIKTRMHYVRFKRSCIVFLRLRLWRVTNLSVKKTLSMRSCRGRERADFFFIMCYMTRIFLPIYLGYGDWIPTYRRNLRGLQLTDFLSNWLRYYFINIYLLMIVTVTVWFYTVNSYCISRHQRQRLLSF